MRGILSGEYLLDSLLEKVVRKIETRKVMKKEQKIVILLLLLAVAVIAVFTVDALRPKRTYHSVNKVTKTPTPSITEEPWLEEKGMIVSVDTNQKTIIYQNFATGKKVAVVYDTKTNISDKYGKVLVASSLKFGDLVDITYKKETGELASISRSSKYWEIRNIEEFIINTENNCFTVNGTNYRLTENTIVIQQGNIIPISDIKKVDKLTVYGIEQEILMVEVTKGHGYIRLKNETGLLGGTISIGLHQYPIETDAVYTVRVGEYQVVMEKEDEMSVADIVVTENTTITIDAAEYGGEVPETGAVWFQVEPFGAKLYIDGEDTYYYETEIELEYGVYSIEVSLGGYISYTGKIKIERPYQNYQFKLMENATSTEEDTEQSEENQGEQIEDNTEESDVSDNNIEDTEQNETDNTWEENEDLEQVSVVGKLDYVIDDAHKTYILKPVGAKVYINEVYIGKVPVAFEKILDPFALVLKNEDREKRYLITPDDNDEDAPYSFPDF